MEETWVKVNLDTDLKYQVSDLGNIRRVKACGDFFYLTPFICGNTGALLVNINMSFNGSKRRCVLKYVNKLVLSSFIGGYYKQRRLVHINNILSDCRLSNLEWMDGFKKGIDIKYIKSIDNISLNYCGIQIKEFLITKNGLFINNIIQKNRGLLFLIFKDNKCVGVFDDFLIYLFILMEKMVSSGRFTPFEGERIKCYIFFKARKWILDSTISFMKSKQAHESVSYINTNLTKNLEIGDFDNIEDEVSDMFNQLTL